MIAVPSTDPLGRVAIVRSAVAGVVSKPVIRRAALSLFGIADTPAAPAWWAGLVPSVERPGAKASAREAALAQILASSVVASPGLASGTIDITATAPTAESAASSASAVADAFVAEQDESTLQARRRDEVAITAHTGALRTAATAAHRRLTDLGGNAPAEAAAARSAAAAQTQVAVTRRDAIKAILAAGSPPLGDGKGVPATIDALQTIYLDQMRQLAHARETLGERHTTVVSLTESVERAAAKLTTEWRRLKVSADAEVGAAHDREDALRRADGSVDATRGAAIAEARLAAQRADAAVLRAEAAAADPVLDNPFRVIARAPVPVAPSGAPSAFRALLAVLAGAFASGAWLKTKRMKSQVKRRGEDPAPGAIADPALQTVSRSEAPTRIDPEASAPLTSHQQVIAPPAEAPMRAAIQTVRLRALQPRAPVPEVPHPEAMAAPQPERTVALSNSPSDQRPRADEILKQALSGLLSVLGNVKPCYGALPTVMVAANEGGVGTTAAALALGQAAAEAGYRVLIVESAKPRPDLAGAADPKAEPLLIDMFGGLRVALRAERCAGALFLAPCFREGSRIASALARGGETPFIEDMADEFDLIVIDGGRAADAAEEDWGADIALRVARFASTRDDDRLIATLALAPEALFGTIAGSSVLPRSAATVPVEDLAPILPMSDVVRPFAAHRPHVQQPQQRPRPQAPRSTMRRRVGLL